ncbi:ATPase-1 [Coleophoma crateriformis]|uniref:ATPase-1 n=1 Tax=Coleophoma crateriformis TaxID=565419 RepID=A0A3D8T0C0_9HELO|nr:ATPase-1 [Coleophoma crateriformis]
MDAHTSSSPLLPVTSDPALYEDWESELRSPVILPSTTNSDDFDALHQVYAEAILERNKEGIVIQHRAWNLSDAFRSEADHIQDTPLKPRQRYHQPQSSPGTSTMPSASSSINYPPSSSPPMLKRSLPTNAAGARKPKAAGGFLLDDESDDDDLTRVEPKPKRRMLEVEATQCITQRRDMDGAEKKSLAPRERIVIDDGDVPSLEELLQDAEAELPAIPKHRTVGGFLIDDEDDILENMEELIAQQENAELAQEAAQPLKDTTDASQITTSAFPSFLGRSMQRSEILTCSGKSVPVRQRKHGAAIPFEQMVAARSTTKAGRAKRSYYGVDIQQLMDDASKELENEKAKKSETPAEVLPSVEHTSTNSKSRRTLMWTEKYRARNFLELCGDDRTHRQVLRWLKAWDPLVFPKSGRTKSSGAAKRPGLDVEEEKQHRKILLLTGPPGLGKTTLAHVCARQAGYEVMEINASDERSRDVVKNRIRTSVGTESVKNGSTVTNKAGQVQKVAHPLCVVVDEVDGVVGGSGGSGEGGFIKALIDLILLDQKNSSSTGTSSGYARKKKKGDDFRLMRPLILICNDVYHPSLRPLRQSSFAEIIHIRKPPIDAVVSRMKVVFEKEGVLCDSDAVRRLCEATWGINGMDAKKGQEGQGEGDLRGVMVVGEWAAGKLKSGLNATKPRLTRKWVDQNMMTDLSHGGGGARGIGRGGVKEVVNRVFLEGAGFPKTMNPQSLPSNPDSQPKPQLGVAELVKKAGMDRLREMVDTSGDTDRIVTDIFGEYPNQPFNDDSILSKPNAAYEWLHFHDSCSSRVFSGQEWELAPYLSQPVLACHHLFSSPARHYFRGQNEPKKWGDEEEPEPLPFSSPRADFQAHEAEKLNRATILTLQSSLNALLLRSFRSPEDIATDLLPYLVRLLTPEIKPIIVGGSGDQKGIASVRKDIEKAMVKRAVEVMGGVGVIFERGKLDGDFGNKATQWVYRMEPPLDTLVQFDTAPVSASAPAPVRYAVRQVLDQEYQKNIIVRENAARQARYRAGNLNDDEDFVIAVKETVLDIPVDAVLEAKRDFFGRLVTEQPLPLQEIDGNTTGQNEKKKRKKESKDDNKVWVSYHEGFSNAVRKPVTVDELMRGL